MRFPVTLLRVVTLAPALLVSFVLTVVMCALLPPALGLMAFLAAAGVLVALALGQFEVPAIATLTLSRLATAAELQVMAPVLAELGGRGITANVVAPGAIETDFLGGAVRDTPDYNDAFANMTALGRVGVPDDIGPMIASLLDPANRWVNGQRIEVSGGQSI